MKKIIIEYGQKIIDEDQFKKAVTTGIEKWLETDITDYDNFVGIQDMARFMWRNLDKRTSGQKRKLTLKDVYQIKEDRKQELLDIKRSVREEYKKLIGRIYLKKGANSS
jgi:hypothetical protein